MTQDEIIEALEENKQQAKEAIENSLLAEAQSAQSKASSLDDQKVVQIVMNRDFPDITYNNMSIAEVLGALRLAQEMVLHKQVHTPMLKYSLGRIAETL